MGRKMPPTPDVSLIPGKVLPARYHVKASALPGRAIFEKGAYTNSPVLNLGSLLRTIGWQFVPGIAESRERK